MNAFLLWFGAAVSVAEIEAGLSVGPNWLALILGHALGGVLLFGAGLLGARTRRNAMETTGEAFGTWGSRFFAALNILQLVGWTAVMIAQATAALQGLHSGFPAMTTDIVLAVLVASWIFVGLGGVTKLAFAAMALLAVLMMVLSVKLVGSADLAKLGTSSVGFWESFELSVAMPLSWLPLIADYTKDTKAPLRDNAVSAVVYTLVSCWMYAIGILIGQTVEGGTLNAALVSAGFGVAGMIVIVFSTVTTTFLDAYSAGESSRAIWSRFNPRLVGVVVAAVGAVLAISGLMDRYIDFLYLIASVFAPMAAVLLTSHFLVRKTRTAWNGLAWLAGFLAYQFAGSSPIGPTLTSLLVAAGLTGLGKISIGGKK